MSKYNFYQEAANRLLASFKLAVLALLPLIAWNWGHKSWDINPDPNHTSFHSQCLIAVLFIYFLIIYSFVGKVNRLKRYLLGNKDILNKIKSESVNSSVEEVYKFIQEGNNTASSIKVEQTKYKLLQAIAFLIFLDLLWYLFSNNGIIISWAQYFIHKYIGS